MSHVCWLHMRTSIRGITETASVLVLGARRLPDQNLDREVLLGPVNPDSVLFL